MLWSLDATLVVELAAIFVMLRGPMGLQFILLKAFVTHESQSKVIMSLGAFNRQAHEPMNFAFTHQLVEDASQPRDLPKVSFRLTFSPMPTPLILFSTALPRDLLLSHQVVLDANLKHALAIIVYAKAMLLPKGFVTYLQVVVGVDLQHALVSIVCAKALLWPMDSVKILQ